MKTQSSPLVIIIVVGIFVATFGFLIFLAIKRREEVFEGEVVDKNIIENQSMNNNFGPGMNSRPGTIMIGNSGGVTHTYQIKVRTDQGKEIHYPVSEGKYEIIKIGDRVSKAKGTTDINIISSDANNTATPTTPEITTPMPPTPPTVGGPTPPTVS